MLNKKVMLSVLSILRFTLCTALMPLVLVAYNSGAANHDLSEPQPALVVDLALVGVRGWMPMAPRIGRRRHC
jgi:hypothetical protein